MENITFCTRVISALVLRRLTVIVSHINHGNTNDSNNGWSRKIPYNTDNIASSPTEKNHISITPRVRLNHVFLAWRVTRNNCLFSSDLSTPSEKFSLIFFFFFFFSTCWTNCRENGGDLSYLFFHHERLQCKRTKNVSLKQEVENFFPPQRTIRMRRKWQSQKFVNCMIMKSRLLSHGRWRWRSALSNLW